MSTFRLIRELCVVGLIFKMLYLYFLPCECHISIFKQFEAWDKDYLLLNSLPMFALLMISADVLWCFVLLLSSALKWQPCYIWKMVAGLNSTFFEFCSLCLRARHCGWKWVIHFILTRSSYISSEAYGLVPFKVRMAFIKTNPDHFVWQCPQPKAGCCFIKVNQVYVLKMFKEVSFFILICDIQTVGMPTLH